MLLRLAIRNFATVDAVALDFGAGLTVLTGETGAGKSILFDALDLLFGARADSGLVRPGAARCELEAEVTLPQESRALRWLETQDLLDPDTPRQLLLRRVLHADGGSKAWVNARQTTLAALRELAESVLDIHGQHAHQALLRGVEQRRLIDDFGGLAAPREAVRTAHAALRDCEQELAALDSAALNDSAQRELLQYQSEELQAFAPGAEEFTELNADFRRLSQADELREDCAWLLERLEGEEAIEDQLGAALRRCEALAAADPTPEDASQALLQSLEAAREARHGLQAAQDRFEGDPERLAEVSERLGAWEDLARKHRCAPAELATHAEELADTLAGAARDDARRQELEGQREALRAAYAQAATALSQARTEAGAALAAAVGERLGALGLAHARLEVEVRHEPEQCTPQGGDSVRLLVSLNPGQPLQPLAKVASGGELARISLAIAVCSRSGRRAVPVLLFDEVDVGVGGAIAEAIGEHLRMLAADNQVLCVTHQPQVAALGRAHLHVRKEVRDGATYSQIQPLDDEARVEELSRMAGGREITEQTRAHARALLAGRDLADA